MIAQLEYFFWIFEQLNYLFRPHYEQILLIIDPDNMNRWTKLALIWGGIWSGVGFVLLSLYFILDEIDEYIYNGLYFIITTLLYGLQNWMFYTYLVRIQQEDFYEQERIEGGYLSKIPVQARNDKSKNPTQLIII